MTERHLKLLKSDQAVVEAPEGPKLSREEAAVMAAHIILQSDPEGYTKQVETWGKAIGELAVNMLQSSQYTPQAQQALLKPCLAFTMAGFLLGLEVAKGDG